MNGMRSYSCRLGIVYLNGVNQIKVEPSLGSSNRKLHSSLEIFSLIRHSHSKEPPSPLFNTGGVREEKTHHMTTIESHSLNWLKKLEKKTHHECYHAVQRPR